MAEAQPLDAERIFQVLARHDVGYVLVGGLAVLAHGHVRITRDVDVIPEPSPENLARLADALNEIGARVLNPGREQLAIDASMLPRATLWQFATRDGQIDVLHDAPGFTSFADLRARALQIALGTVHVVVAGRADLINMKRAAGRPVDLDDIAALTEPEHRPS